MPTISCFDRATGGHPLPMLRSDVASAKASPSWTIGPIGNTANVAKIATITK
jgi:hypothetical protein